MTPLSELAWAFAAISLAVYAFFLFVIMVWASVSPKATVKFSVLVANSLIIGAAGSIAWWIFESFLR